jgi:phosphate transport system permease protein
VNISNLAAVPSIVFGILGLAIFINFMGCRNRPRWSARWC